MLQRILLILRSSALLDSPNEAVYFKITNVEHDTLVDDALDGFSGSNLGEWGCWVDHSITRIVQTGVEPSRVPNANREVERMST